MADPTRVHNVAVGLGGRDVPLELYPRLLEVASGRRETGFAILDLEPDKLPEEVR
jgi:pyruvate ferredoxin oxidoreductase alpha subunit